MTGRKPIRQWGANLYAHIRAVVETRLESDHLDRFIAHTPESWQTCAVAGGKRGMSSSTMSINDISFLRTKDTLI